jgi:predicted RNase H-like HicB family nuclease
MKAEVEVLTKETNNWVIRVPGRQYAAVAIQGDSLKILYDLADEICDLAPKDGELRDVAENLRENLKGRLEVYESALRKHGLKLPYVQDVS